MTTVDLFEHHGDKSITPSSLASGKLVRDRDGQTVSEWTGGGSYTAVRIDDAPNLAEYWLTKKLLEEAHEVADAMQENSRAHIVEELGDLFEVARTLMAWLEISNDEVIESTYKKVTERGTFSEMWLVKELNFGQEDRRHSKG